MKNKPKCNGKKSQGDIDLKEKEKETLEKIITLSQSARKKQNQEHNYGLMKKIRIKNKRLCMYVEVVYSLPVKSLETVSTGFFLIINNNASFSWEIQSTIHERDEV